MELAERSLGRWHHQGKLDAIRRCWMLLCSLALLHSLKRAISLCFCPGFHSTSAVHSHGQPWTHFYIVCVDSVCDILTLLKIGELEALSSTRGETSCAGEYCMEWKDTRSCFQNFLKIRGMKLELRCLKLFLYMIWICCVKYWCKKSPYHNTYSHSPLVSREGTFPLFPNSDFQGLPGIQGKGMDYSVCQLLWLSPIHLSNDAEIVSGRKGSTYFQDSMSMSFYFRYTKSQKVQMFMCLYLTKFHQDPHDKIKERVQKCIFWKYFESHLLVSRHRQYPLRASLDSRDKHRIYHKYRGEKSEDLYVTGKKKKKKNP